MARDLWTREQLILAFNLYLKMPFGQMHSRNPEVQRWATIIGRNANAVAIRLTNFAAVDPYHQQRGIKGMDGGKKQVQPIWDEFNSNKENLVFESERILAEREHTTIESKYHKILSGLENLKGETKVREVKTRVNQHVFRQMVLSNYEGKCAITGIDLPELLIAGHIVPWSENEQERLNPENGICMSSLYDRAFEGGYIGVTEKLDLIVSPTLKKKESEVYYPRYFAPLVGSKLVLPKKYMPKKEFIQYHLDAVFRW